MIIMVLASIATTLGIGTTMSAIISLLIIILVIASIVGIYRQSYKQTKLLERQNELLFDIKYGRNLNEENTYQ